MCKKAVCLVLFFLASVSAQAQINIYMGGNLQGNYSWIRGDEYTMEPGFGGGFSLVYWEYEYWFLKTGVDFSYKTSTILEYPDDFGIAPEGPDNKINITYTEQDIGIPLAIYFRPFELGANTLLITGSLNTYYVAHLKASSEEYGDRVLKGTDLHARVKTNLGIGVGYQLQLSRHQFLNIVPSFNIDLRSHKAYNSITLTAELIFGVY